MHPGVVLNMPGTELSLKRKLLPQRRGSILDIPSGYGREGAADGDRTAC